MMHVVLCILLLVSTASCGKFLFGSSGGGLNLVSWNLAFQNYTGSRVTLAQYATSFTGGYYLDWQKSIMDQAAASGIIPYVSLDPSPLWPALALPNVSMAVLNGEHDTFLNEYCDWLINWLAGADKKYNTSDDNRVYIRFAHEMNIQPFMVDPPRFVLMWRYVWKFFVIRKGIDNLHAQWHWSISGGQSTYDMDRPPFKVEDYYPGDAYVDWIGYDAYNWGNVTAWSHWLANANITHAYSIARVGAISPNKPMCIAETSSASLGGSVSMKNDWINSLFPYISDTDKVQMMLMFNVDADGGDWVYFGTDGNYRGDATFRYKGDAFMGAKNFTAYSSILSSRQYVYAPNPSNKRVLTDAEFFGHLTPSANMCPGTPPCSSRGACDLTGKCACIEGFTGTDCSQTAPIPTCPGGSTCSGKGGCIDGKCVCLPNYVGEACQAYAAPGSLNNTIYHDGFTNGWSINPGSTAPYSTTVKNPVYGGNGTSISINLFNWNWVYLQNAGFYKSDFGALEFYAYVTDVKYLMNLWVVVVAANWNETSNRLYLGNYTVGTVASNSWVKISMPASAFQFKYDVRFEAFIFWPVSVNSTIYLDEMVITTSHPVVIPPIPTTASTATTGAKTTTTTGSKGTTTASAPTSSATTGTKATTTLSASTSSTITTGAKEATSDASSSGSPAPTSGSTTSKPSPSDVTTDTSSATTVAPFAFLSVAACIWVAHF